jgi:hypothetical protein
MVETSSIIAVAGAIIVPVTALLLNYRGFASIDARFASFEGSINNRFASLESSINNRVASVEHRLENIERDLKDFYKTSAEHDKEFARLKDHTRLK